MSSVLFSVLPLVVSATLVAAFMILYMRFHALSILVGALGSVFKLAHSLIDYFLRPSFTLSEQGEVLSQSMPPEWIMILANVLGYSGNLLLAGGLLVFAWRVQPNKQF